MVLITVTEFESNINKYLNLASNEMVILKSDMGTSFELKPTNNVDNPSPSGDPFWAVSQNVAKLNNDIETLKTRKASDFISLEQFKKQIGNLL